MAPKSSYAYTRSVVPSTTRVVRWLLIVNVAVFVLQKVFLNRYLDVFGLVPAAVLGRGFVWQLGTYMFLHGSIVHIFFNMLFIWMMGSEIERYWGSREFIKYYLVTGIGAGLVNVLVQPRAAVPIIGASGAVFGLIIAFAMAFPDREILLYFFIRMKAKHFAIFVGALELLSLVAMPDMGIARFAHLGGLLIGYVYLRYEKLSHPVKRMLARRQFKIEHAARRRQEEMTERMQKEMDRILDKITREGIDSLTDDERRFLVEQSRNRV